MCGDFLKNALLNVRLTFVHTVNGANAHSKRGAVCAFNKFCCLVGVGVGIFACNEWTVVLFTANFTKLGFNRQVDGACNLGYGRGNSKVVLVGYVRAVDHN